MIVITVVAEIDVETISEDAPGALAGMFGQAASNMFGGKQVKVAASVKVVKPKAEPEPEPEATPKRGRMRRKTNG